MIYILVGLVALIAGGGGVYLILMSVQKRTKQDAQAEIELLKKN